MRGVCFKAGSVGDPLWRSIARTGVVTPHTEFSESLCSKDRGGTSRNALDLAYSVQRLSENSVRNCCKSVNCGVKSHLTHLIRPENMQLRHLEARFLSFRGHPTADSDDLASRRTLAPGSLHGARGHVVWVCLCNGSGRSAGVWNALDDLPARSRPYRDRIRATMQLIQTAPRGIQNPSESQMNPR